MARITIDRVRAGTKRHLGLTTAIAHRDAPYEECVKALCAALDLNEAGGRHWYRWIHENCAVGDEPMLPAPPVAPRTRTPKPVPAPTPEKTAELSTAAVDLSDKAKEILETLSSGVDEGMAAAADEPEDADETIDAPATEEAVSKPVDEVQPQA